MIDGESLRVPDFHPVTPGLSRKGDFGEELVSRTYRGLQPLTTRLANHLAKRAYPFELQPDAQDHVCLSLPNIQSHRLSNHSRESLFREKSALSTLSCLESPSRE